MWNAVANGAAVGRAAYQGSATSGFCTVTVCRAMSLMARTRHPPLLALHPISPAWPWPASRDGLLGQDECEACESEEKGKTGLASRRVDSGVRRAGRVRRRTRQGHRRGSGPPRRAVSLSHARSGGSEVDPRPIGTSERGSRSLRLTLQGHRRRFVPDRIPSPYGVGAAKDALLAVRLTDARTFTGHRSPIQCAVRRLGRVRQVASWGRGLPTPPAARRPWRRCRPPRWGRMECAPRVPRGCTA